MKQVRVNVSTLVNGNKIRREKRAGRDVIIVPSATLPDNIVMNGIRYPASVIEKSFHTLEGSLAPLGHPKVDGKYISARSPAGLAQGYIGAHNENVRRENGRVFLDKVIDVEVANRSEGGKAVLEAVDKQEPITTSTGLLATLKPLTNSEDGAKFEAEDMVFDHDCIMPVGGPAATPEQGVGMFVNASGEEIEVVNSEIGDEIDRDIDWQLDSLLRAVERKERQPLLERMKVAILRLVQGDPTPDDTTGDALNDDEEPMDKAQYDALMAKVDAVLANGGQGLTEEKVGEIVANKLKPITDAMEAQAAAEATKAEEDRQTLVNQVVEAGLLEESVAKDAAVPVLNALLAKPKPALRVNRAFSPADNSERKPLALAAE